MLQEKITAKVFIRLTFIDFSWTAILLFIITLSILATAADEDKVFKIITGISSLFSVIVDEWLRAVKEDVIVCLLILRVLRGWFRVIWNKHAKWKLSLDSSRGWNIGLFSRKLYARLFRRGARNDKFVV